MSRTTLPPAHGLVNETRGYGGLGTPPIGSKIALAHLYNESESGHIACLLAQNEGPGVRYS